MSNNPNNFFICLFLLFFIGQTSPKESFWRASPKESFWRASPKESFWRASPKESFWRV
jgi:hypothetical protein